MIKTQIIRCISTRSIVDKWFNALQSKRHEEQQTQLAQCIEYTSQQDQSNYSNLIREIIHRWAIEHPKTEALWAYEANNHDYQKLTFNDIYTNSSQLADVLTGNLFNLTAGKNVLVVLPYAAKDRILIQLACLQSDLIFYFHDSKYLVGQDIRQQIRTSAIDCIITDVDHLEFITKYTHNSVRPLKKGLMTNQLKSEPLPVGWHYLMHSINTSDKPKSKINYSKPSPRAWHHLSSDTPVNYYSLASFSLRQMLIAYWLNMAKTPRLIWLKEANAKFSFAPWLLGSTIFCKDIDNIENMFKTFEANPIDTFCASEPEYHMLDKQQQQQPDSTHLEQLLSTEPINDQAIKSRWYSATNLHIRDNSLGQLADLNNKSALEYKQLDGFDQQNVQLKQFKSA